LLRLASMLLIRCALTVTLATTRDYGRLYL
jgi:hypothetical protein